MFQQVYIYILKWWAPNIHGTSRGGSTDSTILPLHRSGSFHRRIHGSFCEASGLPFLLSHGFSIFQPFGWCQKNGVELPRKTEGPRWKNDTHHVWFLIHNCSIPISFPIENTRSFGRFGCYIRLYPIFHVWRTPEICKILCPKILSFDGVFMRISPPFPHHFHRRGTYSDATSWCELQCWQPCGSPGSSSDSVCRNVFILCNIVCMYACMHAYLYIYTYIYN